MCDIPEQLLLVLNQVLNALRHSIEMGREAS